ncbi:MAG: hypothetical protein K0R71_2161 [Bacillales bacterium]|nr:hypothetical protein [Bacillales bacterium]
MKRKTSQGTMPQKSNQKTGPTNNGGQPILKPTGKSK